MSNSFTNLSILDCNRQSSEQSKSNNNQNPALWSNKLGTGVKLNVGDQVEVVSSFISEQGAGDDETIEFTGKSLDSNHTINFTDITNTEAYDPSVSPTGFAKVEFSASSQTIDLFDNKASISINYFKNANGENYFQLPRKFLAYKGDTGLPGSVNASGSHNLWFAQEDSVSSGNASYSKGGLPFHQVPYFTTTDQKLYYVDADYLFLSGAVYDDFTENKATSQFYKLRNDNSRYMIYVAKTNYYVGDDITSQPTNTTPADYWVNELSQREFIRYSERIDLEVNSGFNSALNVANDLTNQLNKTGEVQSIEYPYNDERAEPYFYPSKRITTYLESPTYKTFTSTSASFMTDVDYFNFNASHTDETPSQSVVDYINTTNYIGIKRPELYDKGILLANGLKDSLGNLLPLPSLTHNYDAGDTLIRTNIGWREDNLELLKALFDEEAKYPELFTNKYNEYGQQAFDGVGTSVDNSRFLHINSRAYYTGTTGLGQLGTDDINGPGSYKDFSTDNFISLPLFIFFDKARDNLAQGGNDNTDLYYGFAQRDSTNKHLMSFYVGANASHCPPPDAYLQYNNNKPAGTAISSGTILGWDTHFTAYSTCAISLLDGWIDETWNGGDKSQPYWKVGINSVWDSGTSVVAPNASSSQARSPFNQINYIRKSYLGANSPKIEYNASSNRFSLSQLHTPEYSGNIANSGGTNASFAIPLNPNAIQKVFKINKRSNCFSWTTALVPFTAIDSESASGTDKFTLELPNINLDIWKIFDSQSGIIINDFGFSENNWDIGLWGILGFSYPQFNSTRTSENIITERLTERNNNLLPYAFTNALVSASDTIDFCVNGWGSPMYNAMLPMTFIWNGEGQTSASNIQGARQGYLVEAPPPITKEQQSVELVATNLPRRMTKPYYCIRSDIMSDSYFLGGQDSGQALPVVAIVNKIDGYGDFYFGEQSGFTFTNTKERMLTNITTSIHYPDQTFANVNLDSAVVYKITKNQPAVSNVVEELLQEMKGKEKKDFLQKL